MYLSDPHFELKYVETKSLYFHKYYRNWDFPSTGPKLRMGSHLKVQLMHNLAQNFVEH